MEWLLTTNDGTVLEVRPITEADRLDVEDLWRRCDKESLFRRFMSGMSTEPSALSINFLVGCDGDSRIGVAAWYEGKIVGVAHGVRVADNKCDLAALVATDWQGRGVGARLCGRIGKLADVAGMTGLVAETMQCNTAVKAMTASADAKRVKTGDFATCGFEMEFAHRQTSDPIAA